MDRLIIELLPPHGHGVDKRYVFEDGKATIGRSYSNDIILDDLYVSPQHLTVSRNGTGFYVTDLASENGTQIDEATVLQGQGAKIASGDEICIGKTRLKFVLPDHPVEPARRMDTFLALRKFIDRRSVAISFTLLVLGFSIWMSFLEAPTEKFWKTDGLEAILGFLTSTGFYVSLLGLVCYIKLRKPYFIRHLAVCNAFTLIWLTYEIGDPFLFFWVSHYNFLVFAKYTIHFVFLLAMFWASVKLANNFVKWADTVKLSIIALVFVLLTGLGAKDIRLNFSADPAYPSHLVPYLEPLSEPGSFEDFIKKSGPKLYNTIKETKD